MKRKGDEEIGRREFLVTSAAVAAILALPGCSQPQNAYNPPPRSRTVTPVATQTAYASPPIMVEPVQPKYIIVPAPPPQKVVRRAPAPAPRPTTIRQPGGAISAVSRNSWGATPAIPAKMKPMNGVTRITIHHEGSAKPNNDVTASQVAATLRKIQGQHRARMGAGDIGYHFIIDRTGCVWQGRDWAYQGAHTSGANAHNIGIMLLGNFEIQQPTSQQLAALNTLTISLMRKYGISAQSGLFVHSDFSNTQCPGKNLRSYVGQMKRVLR